MTQTFDDSLLDMTNKEAQLAEAKARIAGSVPLIENPASCIVQLPRGLLRGDTWESEVEIRELTGEDEEALARVRDNVTYFDTVLAHGTVRIGKIDLSQKAVAERQGIIGELLVGEREQVLMSIIRATYGDTKTLAFTCPNCKTEQDIDILLTEDFKPKTMKNPTRLTYSYSTKKGDDVEYRLVTGSDQLEALGKKGASTAEQNSILLSRVITKVNGQLVIDPLGYARRLSMRDRSDLIVKLLDEQPNIDLTLNTTCVGCGGEQVLPLGWADLFRT